MHIALNAHLLSGKPGYRSAGIHGVIDGLLRHLNSAAPEDWQFTAFINPAVEASFPRVALRRAGLDTTSPVRRIAWEQVIQPFSLMNGGFDLVHSMAFVSPLILTLPSVVTVYDLSFRHYPERLSTMRRLYLQWMTPLSVKRARRVIAISRSTARDLTATLGTPADKIDTAVLGFDRDVFRPAAPDVIRAFKMQNGLPDRFWLFVGTLEPRKNLVTLIEAYAALPPNERPKLVIGGGKGWDTDPIFAAVERLKLADDVLFPGFIPADQLALWYNSAEAFVYPSVFEGFGLPVLEAMACGTPVIVSDASSLPEIAEDAGMLIPPHDPSAWTAALAQAMQDDGWRRDARERGQEKAQRFTWNEHARVTVESYRQALH